MEDNTPTLVQALSDNCSLIAIILGLITLLLIWVNRSR